MDATATSGAVEGGLADVDGVECYRIDGLEHLEPFLTTVVSDGDLWMFVSSTGALTAGRVDADHALFRYETDDLLHRAAGRVGPVTVFVRDVDGRRETWRPFHGPRPDDGTRSIAKATLGNRLVFEEVHRGWGLRFRATWAPSTTHGWVRSVELADAGAGEDLTVEVLDGLLDVQPSGVDMRTEMATSNLVNAYKRSETGRWGTLALFAMESGITDRAEPSEALSASVAWSAGLDDAVVDLDPRSVEAVAAGAGPEPSQLVEGRAGAYLLRGTATVPADGATSWLLVVDHGLGHAEVAALADELSAADGPATLADRVADDVAAGTARLRELLAGADAFQTTGDAIVDAHHLSNVLFNAMRGGVFPYGHDVPLDDLADFLRTRNRDVAARHTAWLDELASTDANEGSATIGTVALREAALERGDPDLTRLVLEYLPLFFGRRHGDPSRPWNRFAIHVRGPDGSQVLSYEGNWRDVFQNWEALLRSFPAYHADVVATFVDASTADGFNPYRISRAGIDWEVPDPEDPWSNIGYWGDHQVVYLLRLLQAWEDHEPGAIAAWFDRDVFVYADVPYTIADHADMVRDPRDTITHDEERQQRVDERVAAVGADGRLITADGAIVHVGLAEKLVVPALAKLSSLVPGGGIWLNTQRPEWNDANNALAGWGLSIVTLLHLRTYLAFLDDRLAAAADDGTTEVGMSATVATWAGDLAEVLDQHEPGTGVDDATARRTVLDAVARAGEAHRHRLADPPAAFARTTVTLDGLRELCQRAVAHLDATIAASRREDGLHHGYNVLALPDDATATVDHLTAMLEGQVAALTSAPLSPADVAALVDAMYASDLHREDLDTFLLYPAPPQPWFLERNVVPEDTGLSADDVDGPLGLVLAADPQGRLRFRPGLPNAAALAERLDDLDVDDATRRTVLDAYEATFHHAAFTGRSQGMHGYEGLGSVYWHMVAKLLVAVQERWWAAVDAGAEQADVDALAQRYRRIRDGLGFNHPPAVFGAFPTDCYSHSPAHSGAQQPGMTGQVKEEVITRFGELGLRVRRGRLTIRPGLVPIDDVVPDDGAATLTYAATPMTIRRGDAAEVRTTWSSGDVETTPGDTLPEAASRAVLGRTGEVTAVAWVVPG